MNGIANFDFRSSCRRVKAFLSGGVLLLSLLSVGWTESRADVPEAQKPEITHLLDYLKNSGCLMERNGSKHDAQKAVEHIQKNTIITGTISKPLKIL